MLLRLAYLGVTNTLALLRLLPMSDRAKDAEILALRHQITVLERQLVRRTPWWMAGFDPDVGALFGQASGLRLDPRWYRVVPLARKDRWVPACEVFTRDGDLVVRMELPGVDPDKDVQVTVEDGVLCISGERRRAAEHDEGGYYRREWAYGGFQRCVPLPDTVSVDDIKASYDKGVLEVIVQKFTPPSEQKRLPVNTAEANKRPALGSDS